MADLNEFLKNLDSSIAKKRQQQGEEKRRADAEAEEKQAREARLNSMVAPGFLQLGNLMNAETSGKTLDEKSFVPELITSNDVTALRIGDVVVSLETRRRHYEDLTYHAFFTSRLHEIEDVVVNLTPTLVDNEVYWIRSDVPLGPKPPAETAQALVIRLANYYAEAQSKPPKR